MSPLNATIDRAGRIVAPKAIRTAARLEPGTELRFRTVSGRNEMEPVPLAVSLERRGRLVVAVPNRKQPVLTQAEVEDTATALRNAMDDGEAA